MTVEMMSEDKGGRVWVRSSVLLPIILPSSPPSTITMDSLARLRAQIQTPDEEWGMDKTRFFMGNQQLKRYNLQLEGGQR